MPDMPGNFADGIAPSQHHKVARPWLRWAATKNLEYQQPLGKTIAFIPVDALYDETALELTTILIRIIGRMYSTDTVARRIRQTWQPEGKFEIKQVNKHLYLIGFWNGATFNMYSKRRWFWLNNDLVLIRPWSRNTDVTEIFRLEPQDTLYDHGSLRRKRRDVNEKKELCHTT